MKIGLLSDTHGYLDSKVFQYFKECDEIWHAGDIGSLEVAHQLKKFKPVRAVFGNIDSSEIQNVFPEHLSFLCEETKVLITHIAGNPPRYNSTVNKLRALHKPELLICGHSHILKVESDQKNKLLFINPGAAGNHGFHKTKTLVRFEINKKKITNLQVIEIGERGKLTK